MNILPHSSESELAIIEGILLNPNEILDLCISSITPSHFHIRSNRIIYEAICQMSGSGKPVDPMTLTAYLRERGSLEEVGGAHYIGAIVSLAPTSAHTQFHIDEVIRKFKLRSLFDIGVSISQNAHSSEDPSKVIEKAESDIFNLNRESKIEDEKSSASREIDERIKRRLSGETVSGIQSGISRFDKVTSGYRSRLNYVFAGPPGGGKTAWAEQCSVYASLRGQGVLFISLEMSADRVLERMSCRAAQVPYWKYINNTLDESSLIRIQKAKDLICQSPLHIICPNDATGPAIRSTIRRFKRKHDIKMVVLDYIQRMKSHTQREPRLIISEASSCFVDALKESDVAGIMISQMNREHVNGRPKMSMLAESSQIEKDADFIGFLWCEVEKETVNPGDPYPFILSIEKNRDGPSGNDQNLLFKGDTLTFKDRI